VKLLQSEIDVVPGRKPQKQPLPEGYVGTGIGTLRINNTTARQNSYTIKLKCDEPFWQESWYTLSALPPTGGAENAPPSGKPDQPGPRNQSLTIFIKDGGTRDVLISFFIPEKSECRAGVYKASVVVETRIVSDDPQARRDRTTEIPVTIIVRPFFKWQVSFTPEERRVGLFRRKTEFELVVDNQSNDWLYCDLKLPRPQNVLIETKAQRLAIPPPDPGRDSVRTVPISAMTRLRVIRGSRTPTTLPLTIQRANAPSIPPLPEEATFGPSSANLGAAVLATDSDDIGVPEVPSKVLYCPPIPDTLTAFFEAVARNIRGLIFALIGFFVLWQVTWFVFEAYVKNISEVRVSTSVVKVGVPFRVNGKNLLGSQILFFDPATKAQIGEPVTPKPDPHNPLEEHVFVTITDKDLLDHHKVIVGARRLGKLTMLAGLLPVVKDPAPIMVGQQLVKEGPPSGAVTASVAPGQDLTIGGVNFGATPGKVLIDGAPATATSWTNTSIQVKVPATKQVGDTFSVAAFTSDGTSIPIVPSTVAIKLPGGGDFPPDQEPRIGPNGELLPPSTQGTSSGGSGGTNGGSQDTKPPSTSSNPPTGSTGDLPPTYDLLLSDDRSDYVNAVSKTRSSNDPGALAVQAFALAALNRDDEAATIARKAVKAIGKRKSGRDLALCFLAMSKAIENANPSKAVQGYASADSEVDQVAPGFVFKDIVIARFKLAQKSNFEARTILKDAQRKSPTPAESSAIQQLLQRAGG
jgi:hypothetical protein